MASPVFHGLAGAGLAYALAADARLPLNASLRRAAPLMTGAAALACLPDLDYLPGVATGALNAFHQQGTHSLAWVVLAAAAVWLAGRIWKPARFGWRAFGFLVLLIGSHLAIDLVTADHAPPYGIPLWQPFSGRPVQAPFALLPAWEKASLRDLMSPANARPFAIELTAGLAVAAGCVAAKRSWTRRRAAI
jgi:membrane-bound metal-dependent hydrolase YbcI (DUF457 family)